MGREGTQRRRIVELRLLLLVLPAGAYIPCPYKSLLLYAYQSYGPPSQTDVRDYTSEIQVWIAA